MLAQNFILADISFKNEGKMTFLAIQKLKGLNTGRPATKVKKYLFQVERNNLHGNRDLKKAIKGTEDGK